MEQARHTEGLQAFQSRVDIEEEKKEEQQKDLKAGLENGIEFVRKTFGEGQELVILLTGILEHPHTGKAMREELKEEYLKVTAFLNADSKEEELRRRISGKDSWNG